MRPPRRLGDGTPITESFWPWRHGFAVRINVPVSLQPVLPAKATTPEVAHPAVPGLLC